MPPKPHLTPHVPRITYHVSRITSSVSRSMRSRRTCAGFIAACQAGENPVTVGLQDLTRRVRVRDTAESLSSANHLCSILIICFARLSLISLCRGTGCETFVLGFWYQSCLRPCLIRTQPISSSFSINSLLFTPLPIHPLCGHRGWHR